MNNQQIFTKIGIKLIPIGGARSLLYRIVRIMKEAGKNLGLGNTNSRIRFIPQENISQANTKALVQKCLIRHHLKDFINQVFSKIS